MTTFNPETHQALRCIKQLAIIPNATPLFEEPGALKLAADLAKDWSI